MTTSERTRPKYQGSKVLSGLYLQFHDDAKTLSVIARVEMFRDVGTVDRWFHGEIEPDRVVEIANDSSLTTEDQVRAAFEAYAEHGVYITKGEAIAEAIEGGEAS